IKIIEGGQIMGKCHIELSKQSIFTNLNCNTREEVLRVLSNSLLSQGFVTPNFFDGILKREKDFPTGLQTNSIGVAIPHADPKYIIHDSIALGILSKPVTFYEMANISNKVDVYIVFLLALTDATKHLRILQKIIEIIKDEQLLKQMLKQNNEELYLLISEKLLTTDCV
ncbi:PTS sugar transporter subunit IIA, partial [Tepidanaerobacter sp. GT38]|uniref:PTS sugar transporter subunit IIA n=1 Tax=Tepidanaerobacter sp. GT38 TaxID=2722793 RepID=UPI001F3E09DD